MPRKTPILRHAWGWGVASRWRISVVRRDGGRLAEGFLEENEVNDLPCRISSRSRSP